MLPMKFQVKCLSVQEEKRKIDFQDGGHLGFPIRPILATFDLQVTPMLPTKFQVNWAFDSSYFSHNTATDMSCKLSPQRNNLHEISNRFLGEKYFKMLSAKTFIHGAIVELNFMIYPVLWKHLPTMHSIYSIKLLF